jgi:hypothetical protein
MHNPIELGKRRYQADDAYVYATDPVLRFDQRRLASMVGYTAIGLPIVLGLGGVVLGDFRSSLSAFYYETVLLGDVFVGALVFIGALMLAYRGWSRKVADLATLGGLCACMVALFPAAGWIVGSDEAIFVLATRILHAVAAAALFLILAFFCFFVFTRVEPHQVESAGARPPVKRTRDAIYRVAGTTILLAIAAIAIGIAFFPDHAQRIRLTFWGETAALLAFGVSWLVQGRASGHLLLDRRDVRDRAIAKREEAEAEAQ